MNIYSLIKKRSATKAVFTAATLSFFALSQSADAVVTITFSESGSDVIAVLSGSLNLAGANQNVNDSTSSFSVFSGNTNFVTAFPGTVNSDYYNNGVATASAFIGGDATSFSGPSSFGYSGNTVVIAGDTPNQGIVTPTGTWTWANKTLDQVLSNNTQQVVHTIGGSGDTIQMVGVVPEPSSTALLGLGGLALLMRRRR